MIKVDVLKNAEVEVKTSGTIIRIGSEESLGNAITFTAEIDGVSYPVDNLVDSVDKLTGNNYYVDLGDS